MIKPRPKKVSQPALALYLAVSFVCAPLQLQAAPTETSKNAAGGSKVRAAADNIKSAAATGLSGKGSTTKSQATASVSKKQPLPHLQMQQPKIAPTLPPPSPEPKGAGSAASGAGKGSPTGAQDAYPVIGQLETITFGATRTNLPISQRLSELELAIYHQAYGHLSLNERSQRLQDTLLGPAVDPDSRQSSSPGNSLRAPRFDFEPAQTPPPMPTQSGAEQPGIDSRTLETWQQPFFQQTVPREQLERFALELVNQERQQNGLSQLEWDDVSHRVATSLIDDLCQRDTVSHLNKSGLNPDVRYTQAGGNDALSESLVSIGGAAGRKLNRALVARSVELLKSHQDDRDALFSPDATHFAYSLNIAGQKDKAICCAEIVTKHANLHPIPDIVEVGQKIEVKGVLLEPYKFQKVTIAWEGGPPISAGADGTAEEVQQDEAMPYFPPLDYVAFASKAEHDREKLIAFLKTAGVVAAIAGGMFMPPVALAAPLIAMSPTNTEPKAAADVPVKGGIKINGAMFSGVVPLSHQGKEGLYYLTIWAATGDLSHPVPISRRTISVRSQNTQTLSSQPNEEEGKSAKKARKRSPRVIEKVEGEELPDAASAPGS